MASVLEYGLFGKVQTLAKWEKAGKSVCYSRPTHGGYEAALLSSLLMAMLLGVFVCYFGFGNRQLIPLHSAWSPMQPDGSVPGFDAEQMLPASSPDQELVEMLRNLEEFPLGTPAVQPKKSGQWRVVRMKVTAYCSCRRCCGRHADGITACNHRIRPGDVFAAADKQYAFGTEMIIPGYNDNQPIKVKDRGRLIKGNRLDVFFPSHQQAKKWGVKTLDVLVKAE